MLWKRLFDIAFDPSGQAVMANNEIKLQQECLKVLLDDKTSDLFFPQWGSEISAFIGKKKTQALMSRLEMTVRNCIERLKQVQIHEAESNPHINEYEVLNQIEYVELEALSVTEWRVKIVVSNLAGDVIASEINL